MKRRYKLTSLLAIIVAAVAFTVIVPAGIALGVAYNVTVNQSDSCCDAVVNGTVVYHGTTANVSVEEGVITTNATFNGSCNTFLNWSSSADIDDLTSMNTTITVDSDETLTGACGEYYNVTVNESFWGTCCNATVNGTVVETGETVNVTVEANTTFSILAQFNGSCNIFYGWGNCTTGAPSDDVAEWWNMTTTMNISGNASLFTYCDYFPTPAPAPTAAPVNYSTVEYSDWMLVGFPYQRQNFIAHDLHWAFYLNSSEGDSGTLCYRTSDDGVNWSEQVALANYSNDYGDWPNYNGSSFGLWYDETYDYVHIGFVNNSDSMLGDTLIYERAQPLANGTLVEDGWAIVEDALSTHLMAPSVCTNTTGYPFVGITGYAWMDGGEFVQLYHSNTSDGTWSEHPDFPMNDFGDPNASYEQWISVIPVTAGNVSVQYAALYAMDGGEFYMYQNYVTHDGADAWTDEGDHLISASYPVADWFMWWVGPYHSEVHESTAYNDDDIFMVYTSYYEEVYYLVYDTANNPEDIWNNGYEDILSNESYVAAMSIFNSGGDLVLTLNYMRDEGPIYTCPYSFSGEVWGNISIVLNETQAESYDDWIVAGYKYGSPLGFMWVYSPDEGTYDLDYGWYGDWDVLPTPIVEEGTPLWYLLWLIPLLAVAGLIIMVLTMRPWGLNMIIIAAVVVIIGLAFVALLVRAIAGT